ncbi:NUDIX domain-containing protein [Ramlibacter alkalitolerans]|uniref:GDP-mannose pyrophosphatase n=1 Tax=Ramlibacter alkalitolerans TaxID=2039631 RepID=A0ABS1JJU9_9BURK|nr:NUDIX hydrolase [Ramlibacter alkalitolerans]MBL0424386.1 NUDIX hydrolase [Ramlibacter alkalitolerans]
MTLDPHEDIHLREHTQAREELLKGHFLHVVRETVRLPDGGSATREYVLHPGAVAIVALLDDGRLVLERQYRHPTAKVMIEIPAGKLDAGEEPLACAQRELLEETGYVAREWAFAFTMYPTVAYSDEAIHIWFARGLEHRGAQLDEGEFLDVIAATPEEFLQWCRDGRVQDSKTLASAIWVQNVTAGAWKLDWQPLPSQA